MSINRTYVLFALLFVCLSAHVRAESGFIYNPSSTTIKGDLANKQGVTFNALVQSTGTLRTDLTSETSRATAVGVALGLTDAQIDDIFIGAEGL